MNRLATTPPISGLRLGDFVQVAGEPGIDGIVVAKQFKIAKPPHFFAQVSWPIPGTKRRVTHWYAEDALAFVDRPVENRK